MNKFLHSIFGCFWKYGSQYMEITDPHHKYLSPTRMCMQIRKCSVCDKKEQRISHIYQWGQHLSQRPDTWTNTFQGQDVGQLMKLKGEEIYE